MIEEVPLGLRVAQSIREREIDCDANPLLRRLHVVARGADDGEVRGRGADVGGVAQQPGRRGSDGHEQDDDAQARPDRHALTR